MRIGDALGERDRLDVVGQRLQVHRLVIEAIAFRIPEGVLEPVGVVAAVGVLRRIRRVVAQGSMVVVHSLSRTSGSDRGTVLLDLFRFNRRNRIVEHWDVLQRVPQESANPNTMF